jgi:SAM-dependent methyltransferase
MTRRSELHRTASYERIGLGYTHARRTEPRIAERIFAALGDARSVLNVGAGTGSYEPPDRDVLAVEPSRVMRSQRPPDAAPCINACAEVLPLPDRSFDAALAVLSDHHWRDPIAGLREMLRVARRVVIFQWDDAEIDRFWLVRDYLPGRRRAFATRFAPPGNLRKVSLDVALDREEVKIAAGIAGAPPRWPARSRGARQACQLPEIVTLGR